MSGPRRYPTRQPEVAQREIDVPSVLRVIRGQEGSTSKRQAKLYPEAQALQSQLPATTLPVRLPPTEAAESSFDITSFPSILAEIMAYLSPTTLVILLQCSRVLFHAAAPKLYRHLRLTHRQFKKMLAVGEAPTMRGVTSGILGRSFSPFLKAALPHVRSLQLLEVGPRSSMPTVPRGCLTGVETLVMHPTSSQEVDWQAEKELTFPLALRGQMKTSNLVVRISDTAEHPKTPIIDFDFKRLTKSNQRITLLIPFTIYSPASPFFAFFNDHPELQVTTVLLPPVRRAGEYHHAYRGKLWAASRRIKRELPAPALLDSSYHQMRLVGGEYLGLTPAGLKELVGECDDYSSLRYPIQFTRFEEWLGEQAPGALFTGPEEEEALRAADREVVGCFGPRG